MIGREGRDFWWDGDLSLEESVVCFFEVRKNCILLQAVAVVVLSFPLWDGVARMGSLASSVVLLIF